MLRERQREIHHQMSHHIPSPSMIHINRQSLYHNAKKKTRARALFYYLHYLKTHLIFYDLFKGHGISSYLQIRIHLEMKENLERERERERREEDGSVLSLCVPK